MINLRKGVSTGSAKITGFKTTVWATLLAVCKSNVFCFCLLILSVCFLRNRYPRRTKRGLRRGCTGFANQGKTLKLLGFYLQTDV